MRRFAPVLAFLLAVPLLAATVPASRVKEPNAVFAYGRENGRITAVLFDRKQRKIIDRLDARTPLPLVAYASMGGNDQVQFSPATGKIYAAVHNRSAYDDSVVDEKLGYGFAIVQTNFEWEKPATVFSCDSCHTEQWIVHPALPKLYVSLAGEGVDEFRAAKLLEITLAPTLRTRVIGRIPNHAQLRITPDGKKLFTFGRAKNSDKPYGALVTIDLRTRTRTQSIVNFPRQNAFGMAMSPMAADASPDALEMAFHLGVIDVRTGKSEHFLKSTPHVLDNWYIGWSRDANRVLFQLKEQRSDPNDREAVPLLYDRSSKREWTLDVDDANLLDWAPAQTAILFAKRGDVGFYDLEKREWVFVAEGIDGSWVTMPTKRVPKR